MVQPSFTTIPEDFPRSIYLASVSGAHPKLLVQRTEQGYETCDLGAAAREDYEKCQDLAHQLAALCERKIKELNSKERTVGGVYLGLVDKNWVEPPQAVWIMKRVVKLLGWPETALARVRPIGYIDLPEAEIRALLHLDDPPRPAEKRPLTIVDKVRAKMDARYAELVAQGRVPKPSDSRPTSPDPDNPR